MHPKDSTDTSRPVETPQDEDRSIAILAEIAAAAAMQRSLRASRSADAPAMAAPTDQRRATSPPPGAQKTDADTHMASPERDDKKARGSPAARTPGAAKATPR